MRPFLMGRSPAPTAHDLTLLAVGLSILGPRTAGPGWAAAFGLAVQRAQASHPGMQLQAKVGGSRVGGRLMSSKLVVVWRLLSMLGEWKQA